MRSYTSYFLYLLTSVVYLFFFFFFFSSRRRHTRSLCDWSSDVCSSDLMITHLDGTFSARTCRAIPSWCVIIATDAPRARGRAAAGRSRESRREKRNADRKSVV